MHASKNYRDRSTGRSVYTVTKNSLIKKKQFRSDLIADEDKWKVDISIKIQRVPISFISFSSVLLLLLLFSTSVFTPSRTVFTSGCTCSRLLPRAHTQFCYAYALYTSCYVCVICRNRLCERENTEKTYRRCFCSFDSMITLNEKEGQWDTRLFYFEVLAA